MHNVYDIETIIFYILKWAKKVALGIGGFTIVCFNNFFYNYKSIVSQYIIQVENWIKL